MADDKTAEVAAARKSDLGTRALSAVVMLAVAGWVTFRVRRHHAGVTGSGSGVDMAKTNTENGTDK